MVVAVFVVFVVVDEFDVFSVFDVIDAVFNPVLALFVAVFDIIFVAVLSVSSPFFGDTLQSCQVP